MRNSLLCKISLDLLYPLFSNIMRLNLGSLLMLKQRFIWRWIAACMVIGGGIVSYLAFLDSKPDNLLLPKVNDIKVNTSGSAYEQALLLIKNNQASAVVVKNNKIAAQELGKGILPLLNLHDMSPNVLEGGDLIDKVIGRAAAFIAINGKVRSVYGEMMSEDAFLLLKQHNIPATYGKLVPKILNRDKSGLCPMEQTVWEVKTPQEALLLLRQKLKDLNLSK